MRMRLGSFALWNYRRLTISYVSHFQDICCKLKTQSMSKGNPAFQENARSWFLSNLLVDKCEYAKCCFCQASWCDVSSQALQRGESAAVEVGLFLVGRRQLPCLCPLDRTAVSIGTSSLGVLVHNFPLTATGSPRMATSQPVPIHNRKVWYQQTILAREEEKSRLVSASILEPEQSFVWYRPCCHLHKRCWAPKRKMYSSEIQVWCLQAGTPEKATLWGPWTKMLWWL